MDMDGLEIGWQNFAWVRHKFAFIMRTLWIPKYSNYYVIYLQIHG